MVIIKENVQISFYNIEFYINPVLLCVCICIILLLLNYTTRLVYLRKCSGNKLYDFLDTKINDIDDISNLQDKIYKIDIMPIFFSNSEARFFKDIILIKSLLLNLRYEDAVNYFFNNKALLSNRKWNRVVIKYFSKIFDHNDNSFIYYNNTMKESLYEIVKLFDNDVKNIGSNMYIQVCILNSDIDLLIKCIKHTLKKKIHCDPSILLLGLCFLVENIDNKTYCYKYILQEIDKVFKFLNLDFQNINEDIYPKVVFLAKEKVSLMFKFGEKNNKILDFVSIQFANLKNFKIIESDALRDILSEDFLLQFELGKHQESIRIKYMAINNSLHTLRNVQEESLNIMINDTKSFLCYIKSIVNVKNFAKLSSIFSHIEPFISSHITHEEKENICSSIQYDEWFCLKCISYKDDYSCICKDCGAINSITIKNRV